ncbi:MAG TPA: spore germination protein GerW family protein [Actinomycetospora sp.]|nr:spore germination protein GerW family protein [Actinomycetospora sp.]
MDVTEALEAVRDRLGRQQVFGEPVTQNGTIVLPVVRFLGGAGGGEGEEEPGSSRDGKRGGRGRERGSGLGFGFGAGPAGVYTIRDGNVTWQPAVDANRVILGGQLLGALALVLLGVAFRSRRPAAPVVVAEAADEPGPDTDD